MSGSDMMKAVGFTSACDAKDLKVIRWKKPSPKENEVLVKVHAFGLNFADISARKGHYKEAPPFPFVAGYECSGVVAEFGSEEAQKETGLSVGDRVTCFCDFGAYAEYVVVRSVVCLPIPDSMSFEVAAAFPVQYCTAFHCLYETGSFREGDRVLIHACAGGVGTASLQFCKKMSAISIGTCGSDKKVELIKENGVTHAINYNQLNYEEAVRKLYPDGVDIILNSLGGDTIKKDLSLLRAGGRVVCFGGAQFNNGSGRGILGMFSAIPKVMSMITMNAINLLMESKSVCGVNMKTFADQRPDRISWEMKEILALIEDGSAVPNITETVSWDKVGELHSKMENRQTTGKIVFTIPQEEEKKEEIVEEPEANLNEESVAQEDLNNAAEEVKEDSKPTEERDIDEGAE